MWRWLFRQIKADDMFSVILNWSLNNGTKHFWHPCLIRLCNPVSDWHKTATRWLVCYFKFAAAVFSRISRPMTLNKELPWTPGWTSLPVWLNDRSVKTANWERNKQLCPTELNSKQGQTWQHPCIERQLVKKLWSKTDDCSNCVTCTQDVQGRCYIIIVMYIYHALINALNAHMIHINLNMIFCTHVEHSPTNFFYIKCYKKLKL